MATTPHSDWASEPSVMGPFEPIYNHGQRTDGFVAYISGRGVNGKSYSRAIEVTGRMMENGQAEAKLGRALDAVIERGPSFCAVVSDGGDLPREFDQPEL